MIRECSHCNDDHWCTSTWIKIAALLLYTVLCLACGSMVTQAYHESEARAHRRYF